MKIAHHLVSMHEGGGIPRAVTDVSRALASAGHEVTLLTSRWSRLPAELSAEVIGNLRVVLLDDPRPPLGRLSRRCLTSVARELQAVDVVHLHGLWRPSASQIAALVRRLGLPYVLSTHGMLDDWCMRQRPILKRIYYRLFERRNFAHARCVHATAEVEWSQASRWVMHDRARVIPPCLDLHLSEPRPEPEVILSRYPRIAPDSAKVLFLSRLDPKKGLDIAIRAIGRLKHRGVRCQLLIAGSGEPSYVRSLENLTRAVGVAQDAVFLGLVAGQPKYALYELADVVVLPTSQENFGIVIAEALACGTPVITTSGADIWRELDDNEVALIVERNPGAFAAAIEELLEHDDRRQAMGRRGRSWIATWLEMGSVLGRYERMYSDAREPAPSNR